MKRTTDEGHANLAFLRAFLSELLGRYCFLIAFVEQSRRDAKERSPNLFAAYGAELRKAFQELVDLGSWIAEDGRPHATDIEGLYGAFDFFSDAAVRFQQFHSALRHFATPWPDTEVSQFLAQLFREAGLAAQFQELNPTIVHSDEFNFFKYDLRDDLELGKDSTPLAVWALPKAEGSNPLLWPVLAHEVSHSLFREEEIFARIDPVIRTNFSAGMQLTLRNWSLEFNADYFAYRLLGPAYVCCLMYFSTFFVTDRLRDPVSAKTGSTSVSHPPPALRIKALLAEMERDGHYGARFEAFKMSYEARLRFDHESRAPYEQPDLEDETIKVLLHTIRAAQVQIIPELQGVHFSADDLTSSVGIADQLMSGTLGASVQSKAKREHLAKITAQYRKALEKEGLRSPDGASMPSFKKTTELQALNERPAKVAEIVNAGWIAKISQVAEGSAVSEFLKEKSKTLDTRLKSGPSPCTKFFSVLERQLQKSIQVSLVLASLPISQGDID